MSDAIFVIERCIAPEKQWNSRINEAKYSEFTNKMSEAIKAMVPHAQVVVNRVPKEHAMSDIYCQMIPNEDENNLFYDMLPRMYAFEVSFQGVLLYSKVMSLTWPSVSLVAPKCYNAAQPGANVMMYQTTGSSVSKKQRPISAA